MSLKDEIKVMVVDDMSTSRGLITQALNDIGIWNIETENAGDAAFSSLKHTPVHLILSDMNMPGMDGLGLLAAVRGNAATKGTGFILVTGSPSPDIMQQGQALGLNNMIQKPFTAAAMKQCIERVVGRL